MSHADQYLTEAALIADSIKRNEIESIAQELVALRKRGGRLFFLGLGGSAANCSHAVNDFRKLCHIEAYAPTDNVAELTARANDDGMNYIFNHFFWDSKDALFILSVGGGTSATSSAIKVAIDEAPVGMKIFGIVGRNGGYTKLHGDHVIVIPTVEPSRVTPHTEAFQSVILHCLVSHPDLQVAPTKW